jgi:hypothetical protein
VEAFFGRRARVDERTRGFIALRVVVRECDAPAQETEKMFIRPSRRKQP